MSQAQRHARPLNRSESQVRTRAALLDAAEALIVEHSIPALSLRAVCTRAGYTQGAFYSNFADREELLLEVMERNLEQKAASLEQMLATCGDAGLDGTLACILDWLDTIHHRGEWARIARV
ncbi:TetR family transcriptional regulator [Stenotrophomonas maltophilia]|uniref:TetR family transcriptional regulator n=1 Tax=Stenotrophomonas maltophilia TaxID=40324 RepID=UPI0013D9F4F9|nr:TetR/AcrR family transcriptional regulator [Stenotrophomonas maltophilia]